MVALAWFYLLYTARPMPGMDMSAMQMPGFYAWGLATVILLFLMWAVMMVAMMLPSAVPMIQGFLAVNDRRRNSARAVRTRRHFRPGIHRGLDRVFRRRYSCTMGTAQSSAALAHDGGDQSHSKRGAAFAAGIFQWTPLKSACLTNCRSPLSFLMQEWREGAPGAFTMGLQHGAYCVGCCWALMALLFVVGVMNLLWIAIIAIFVMAEKVLPGGPLGRIAGVALAVAGIVVMTQHG